jgi:hydrogenase expression/formation protein HypD
MKLEAVIAALRRVETPVSIMEVCGTHTAAIFRNGIRGLISPSIRLISGPGCPVCVTPAGAIDDLVEYAFMENHTVLSFGDLFRVRGNGRSLAEAKAAGGGVRLMVSPFDALPLALENPKRTFVLAAVGFETTAPVYAALLEECIQKKAKNIKLYMALKTMPEILEYVCKRETIDAFLCPGHVSAVTGWQIYEPLCARYRKPFVVAGFEAAHILTAIYEAIRQLEKKQFSVKNFYPSAVSREGSFRAKTLLNRYFKKADSVWRGIGKIENSGYDLKEEFQEYRAASKEGNLAETARDGCRCAEVVLGKISPPECPMFEKICNPQNPLGPCMVSAEGACGVWKSN